MKQSYTPYPGTRSVLRALALLNLFSDEEPSWRATELAAALSLNRTTTYRLLRALESHELLSRDPGTDLFRLGSALIALSWRAQKASPLFRAGRSELEWLGETCRESATIEILVDGHMMVFEEAPGRHLIGSSPSVGTLWPALATATGRAILAHLPSSALAGYLRPGSAQKDGPSLGSAGEIRKHLAEIREQGFAVLSDTMEAGLVAISAPVKDRKGRPIGALGISGPAARLSARLHPELGVLIRETAARISTTMFVSAPDGSTGRRLPETSDHRRARDGWELAATGRSKAYPGTQAVNRGMLILGAFRDEQPALNLTTLSRRVNLNRTTVYRILTALQSGGLIDREASSNQYRLGSRLIVLGGRALRAHTLLAAAKPVLRELADRTDETATLDVLSGTDTLMLDEVKGSYMIGMTSSVGSRWPAHASSTGKVLLAHQPADLVESLLKPPLERLTPDTIVDLDQLNLQLRLIRSQGFAIAVDELELGYSDASAPVFSHRGEALAALSIGGASARLTPAKLTSIARLLRRSARNISYHLGYRG